MKIEYLKAKSADISPSIFSNVCISHTKHLENIKFFLSNTRSIFSQIIRLLFSLPGQHRNGHIYADIPMYGKEKEDGVCM